MGITLGARAHFGKNGAVANENWIGTRTWVVAGGYQDERRSLRVTLYTDALGASEIRVGGLSLAEAQGNRSRLDVTEDPARYDRGDGGAQGVALHADGSGVILHSTPSMSRLGQPGGGVQIGAVGESEQCEAYRLADQYMTKYYPAWHERYPTALKSPELYFALKLEENGRFSWNEQTLSDPEGIRDMLPEEALEVLFGEKKRTL